MSKLAKLSEDLANVRESMGDYSAPVPAPGPAPLPRVPAHLLGVSRDKSASLIEVGRIVRDPNQPREEFEPEALARLAESLKARGQLQPIRVRWDPALPSYVVVVGERRWRAAALAGMERLSCLIEETPPDPDRLLEDQLVENALREDLKPVEQARAYRRLMEAKGYSTRDLGGRLAISHVQVTRSLALLDLPEDVKVSVDAGELSASSAYQVSKVPGPAAQSELARLAIAEGLTRDDVAETVKALKARRPAPAARPASEEFDVGDQVITVRWKRAGPTAAQGMQKALKMAKEREAAAKGEGEAA